MAQHEETDIDVMSQAKTEVHTTGETSSLNNDPDDDYRVYMPTIILSEDDVPKDRSELYFSNAIGSLEFLKSLGIDKVGVNDLGIDKTGRLFRKISIVPRLERPASHDTTKAWTERVVEYEKKYGFDKEKANVTEAMRAFLVSVDNSKPHMSKHYAMDNLIIPIRYMLDHELEVASLPHLGFECYSIADELKDTAESLQEMRNSLKHHETLTLSHWLRFTYGLSGCIQGSEMTRQYLEKMEHILQGSQSLDSHAAKAIATLVDELLASINSAIEAVRALQDVIEGARDTLRWYGEI
jgi:hypothetical protein